MNAASQYIAVGKTFAAHGRVKHKNFQWAKGEFYTNSAEGYFSLFKRGMRGVISTVETALAPLTC